jgi:serine/threonine-protein kinase
MLVKLGDEARVPNDDDTRVLGRAREADARATGPTLGSTGALPALQLEPQPRNAHSPQAGAMVGGTYRVLGRLGEGAMGVILLAQDERLQRKVAIKLLRPEQVDNHAMQVRLLDEAQAMARVHHPNVVEIYAYGTHEDAPYFVMQYVEGVTLAGYARRRGGPPLGVVDPRGRSLAALLPAIDEALSIIDQTCLGVAAIHASGVAHRDLKPSNILIGPAFHVAVADLGLARKVGFDKDLQPSFSGTPAFLAPEVALQRQLDPALLPRTDVYALGLIAYWLLLGSLPFSGKNVVEVFTQHAYRPPPRPSEILPQLPSSFDEPLLAALAKDPEQRTESPEALRCALLAARDEVPLSRAQRS